MVLLDSTETRDGPKDMGDDEKMFLSYCGGFSLTQAIQRPEEIQATAFDLQEHA